MVQAFALADIITSVFQHGATLSGDAPGGVLVAVVAARVVLSYAGETTAQSSAATAKSQLRMALLTHVVGLGPVWLAGRGEGELATVSTRGIDALDAYFARYLLMLVLAVTVPIIGGVAILTQDLLAAVIVAFTLPLIPVFMILVGRYTQAESIGSGAPSACSAVTSWMSSQACRRWRSSVARRRRRRASGASATLTAAPR